MRSVCVQWKGIGMTSGPNFERQMDQLKEQIRISSAHEAWLDDAIEQMQTSLRALAEDSENSGHAYVTHDDIRSIASFTADTIIAIKAPSGTTLEVPDPDEGMEYPQRRYQIYLKSQAGPVEVFLVSQAENEAAPMDILAAAMMEESNEGARNGDGHGGEVVVNAGVKAEGDDTALRRKRRREGDDMSPERPPAAGDVLLKLSPVSASKADYWTTAQEVCASRRPRARPPPALRFAH